MTVAPHAPTPMLRRPPARRDGIATVTLLAPLEGRPEAVPIATVQGTLALDLQRLPEQPTVPDLRAVAGDEVQAWAARFAQAALEVLGGDRPVTQLLRLTDARVYAEIERRVRILGRAAPGPRRPPELRPQVRSVHVCRPAAQAAEVSVHVRHGHRSRALAARLERREGRWLCVALQLG
jgi:hypothetical protein